VAGLLIAMEGIDGSGKGTQAALLQERLNRAGTRTALLSFPRYQQTAFGTQIGRFLNGEFGGLDQVHPILASLLFAGDRFESRSLILQSLADHAVVLCDRYVASNIAHQAAKRSGPQRQELVDWIERLEFGIYQLPQPQLTIWLDVPVAQAQKMIARKARRTYTDKAADLQEADGEYLQQVREVYGFLAKNRPGWRRIDCLSQGQLRSIDEIAEEIFKIVESQI
jgi:dTMP kinase